VGGGRKAVHWPEGESGGYSIARKKDVELLPGNFPNRRVRGSKGGSGKKLVLKKNKKLKRHGLERGVPSYPGGEGRSKKKKGKREGGKKRQDHSTGR